MSALDLVVRVATALVVTWLAFLLLLLLIRPRGMDFADAKRFVPDVIRLVRDLAKDRSLGRGPRVKLLLLLAYLASPFDLVPDFVPVLGYADDLIIVAAVFRCVIRRIDPESLDQHGQGTPQGLEVVRRLAGISPNEAGA